MPVANEDQVAPQYPIYVVLGSGGHTAEMCILLRALLQSSRGRAIYTPLRFVVAKTDTTSRTKVTKTMEGMGLAIPDCAFINAPRSREVGQGYFSSIFTTLWALFWSFWLVWRDQPRLVLCNGPGTCVPFCVAAYVWRCLGRLSSKTKIVFVESICRVKSLSLSGRLLRPFVDLFVVQWPTLAERYKSKRNVRYFGNIM